MTRFRIAVFAAALAVVTTASARTHEFLLQSGHEAWVHSGHVLDQRALVAKYGDHFAAFVRDGRTYVITDPVVLADLEREYGPIAEVARQQAELGSRQAKLGSKQAEIGAEQAKIGAQQAAIALSSDRDAEEELSVRQKQLSERQQELSDRQKVLGDEQHVLQERQDEISRRNGARVERIFDDAIASGKARAE